MIQACESTHTREGILRKSDREDCEANEEKPMGQDETSKAVPAWRAFTPDDSPKTPEDMFNDPTAIDLRTAKVEVGGPAHDFDLPIYDYSDGSERATGERFNLGTRSASRPVALIFGSYT